MRTRSKAMVRMSNRWRAKPAPSYMDGGSPITHRGNCSQLNATHARAPIPVTRATRVSVIDVLLGAPESSITRPDSAIRVSPSGHRDSLNLLPTKSYFFLRMRLSALAARYGGPLRKGRRVLSNDGAAFTQAGSPTGRATRQDRDLSRSVDLSGRCRLSD